MLMFRLTLLFRLSTPASASALAIALGLALAFSDLFAITFPFVIFLTLVSEVATRSSRRGSIRLHCCRVRLVWHDCGTGLSAFHSARKAGGV